METNDLWVVVPFFNEEQLIIDTLDSLFLQTDRNFSLVLVDNGSTDNSTKLAQDYIDKTKMRAIVISERQKGTGTAADSGFRFAIDQGAKYVARTDSDTIVHPEWIERIKAHLDNGALIVGGKMKPRDDEPFYTKKDGVLARFFIRVMEIATPIVHRHRDNNYRVFMVPGPNMAIEANLYEKVGGFPRVSIEDLNEDTDLYLRVCKTINSNQAHFAKDVVAYGSIRRVKQYGYLRTLFFYWDRKVKLETVDIR